MTPAAILQASSKSFALAARLLPRREREAVAAMYAWCRRADDAVDLVPAPEAAPALARLRDELASVYAGEPQRDPVLAAFQRVVHARGVPVEYPTELLAGMAMDVAGTRYRSVHELLLYCYRVAGTVGLMLCHVLGVRDAAALPRAAHLGMAMQLTNICRDVREDRERGRRYVPDELVPDEAALPSATATLLALAERLYRSGDRGARALSFRAALAVRAARWVYAAIGAVIRRRGYDVLGPRAVVPTTWKLWFVARAAVATLAEAPSRAVARFRPAPLERVLGYPHDVLPLRAG